MDSEFESAKKSAINSSKIKGILAPVLSAFNDRAQLDTPRTIAHCRWLLENGCNGLLVFGTTSEANSLSVSERKQFLEDLISNEIDPSRLMLGSGCCSLTESVELTRHAVTLGCAGVLVLPPFYYKAVSDEGLFRYFSLLIDKVADERLRLYLYHIPALTGVPISLGLVERLLHQFLGIVAGIKDSSGDWANTEKLLRFVPHGFDVFTGYETYLLATLEHRGAGTISAMANIAACTLQELFQTWNEPGAQAHQEAINKVQTAFQSKPLISSLKAILAKARGDAGWTHVHPPLMPLSVSEREELFTILDGNPFTWPVIR